MAKVKGAQPIDSRTNPEYNVTWHIELTNRWDLKAADRIGYRGDTYDDDYQEDARQMCQRINRFAVRLESAWKKAGRPEIFLEGETLPEEDE